MNSNEQLNRIANLLDKAYIELKSNNLDTEAVLGLVAEAKALAENDFGSFDEENDDEH